MKMFSFHRLDALLLVDKINQCIFQGHLIFVKLAMESKISTVEAKITIPEVGVRSEHISAGYVLRVPRCFQSMELLPLLGLEKLFHLLYQTISMITICIVQLLLSPLPMEFFLAFIPSWCRKSKCLWCQSLHSFSEWQ